MDAEGTATKAEEKTEVLNAFFVSVFNSKTEYPQGSWPPELVREQKRSPAVQEEVVSGKGADGAGRAAHQASLHASPRAGLPGVHRGHSSDLSCPSFPSVASRLAPVNRHHPRTIHFKASNRNSSVVGRVLLW